MMKATSKKLNQQLHTHSYILTQYKILVCINCASLLDKDVPT